MPRLPLVLMCAHSIGARRRGQFVRVLQQCNKETRFQHTCKVWRNKRGFPVHTSRTVHQHQDVVVAHPHDTDATRACFLCTRMISGGFCKWMTFKVCGKEDPAQDDHPRLRAALLGSWKKAISHFFHTDQKWNENSQTGNPAQSALVN